MSVAQSPGHVYNLLSGVLSTIHNAADQLSNLYDEAMKAQARAIVGANSDELWVQNAAMNYVHAAEATGNDTVTDLLRYGREFLGLSDPRDLVMLLIGFEASADGHLETTPETANDDPVLIHLDLDEYGVC